MILTALYHLPINDANILLIVLEHTCGKEGRGKGEEKGKRKIERTWGNLKMRKRKREKGREVGGRIGEKRKRRLRGTDKEDWIR